MSTATKQLPFPYLEAEGAPRPDDFIPVYEPDLGSREEEFIVDAVRSGWISSLGKYITRFEESFASFCGTDYGVSASNGTAALHLATHALGLGPGDEVIIPDLTFIASASAVHYTGARPVFADVDPVTWTLDIDELLRTISPATKAVMPVHLYGHMADMAAINEVAAANGLWVIEDAAEAHGAAIEGQRAGSWGTIGAFSFYANKLITTGEGGMLTTNAPELAARCRQLRDHAMLPDRRYWHEEVGFNYRMTNLQAAVGLAQMERIEMLIRRKREIAQIYSSLLADVPGITLPAERSGTTNIYWMYSILVDNAFPLTRDNLVLALRRQGIDSRPFFHPLDTLPPFLNTNPCSVALRVSRQGINLPSSPRLSDDQVSHICAALRRLAG